MTASRFAVGVAAALALATVGVAVGQAATKVIAHATRLKGTNVWYAQGNAVAPRSVSARLVPTPAQPVKVQWSLVCQKPNSADPAIHLAASGTSGQSSVHGAATVRLRLPYAKAPACVATVYATLARRGKLDLRVLQS